MTSDSDIVKMFEWIESNPDLGKVDVCVPNAGYAASSSLLQGEWLDVLTDVPSYKLMIPIPRQSV